LCDVKFLQEDNSRENLSLQKNEWFILPSNTRWSTFNNSYLKRYSNETAIMREKEYSVAR